MIELNMRRTWSQISDYLNSGNANLLRITEIVNRVPPCSWTFLFTFNNTNNIEVWIDCDYEVSDSHAQSLLDGLLEEIFFTDKISLRQKGKYFTADTSEILHNPLPSNLIKLKNYSESEADSLLTLKGFWQSNSIPPEMQRNHDICYYFLENTWLGSPGFTNSEHCIRWIIFGTEHLIQPGNRYKTKLSTADIFSVQVDLYDTNKNNIGQANFLTTQSLENDELYTIFGPLVSKKQKWLPRKSKDLHWIVEINSETLKQAVIQGEPTTRRTNELVDSVGEAWVSITESDSFKNYEQKIKRKQQIKAANKLRERQDRIQTANKVFFNDRPLMLIPSNENEVIVLLSKLDALGALPFHEFFLWEYTSRAGIDALASYQIKDVDVRSMYSAIEVEHNFENFFDHDHPHHQVNMVICWDFRDGEAPVDLRQQDDWLFEYRNDKSFTVLVLSRIPNLKIKESNNEQR